VVVQVAVVVGLLLLKCHCNWPIQTAAWTQHPHHAIPILTCPKHFFFKFQNKIHKPITTSQGGLLIKRQNLAIFKWGGKREHAKRVALTEGSLVIYFFGGWGVFVQSSPSAKSKGINGTHYT